jgi:hypothetical protein
VELRTKRGGGLASPPFLSRHAGAALVCGSAWCLADDLARARALYPDAPAIAVNGASALVQAVALYSKHPERFTSWGWIAAQFKLHAVGRRPEASGDQLKLPGGFTVHGSKAHDGMPWVDHWWPDARGGGGSVWGARKLAWLMGFDPVILCGAPLTPGNYADHKPGVLMTQPAVIEQFRRQIAAEPEWHHGVMSMSGWTEEFLGAPPPGPTIPHIDRGPDHG